jgi:ribosomal protein S18 acetylase RimI-like enzyme
VSGAYRRRGIARALVTAGIGSAAEDGLGVVLETTNPENHPYYRALGFEILAATRLGEQGPEIWVLSVGAR